MLGLHKLSYHVFPFYPLQTATYREDFEAERQEREEKANVVDSLKANLSLQHQYLDEYQEKLQANVQVSERLYEDIQVLELKRKEEAEQSEARLKEKEGTHEEEMNLSKAKEISFKDEIQNLTTKNEQLQNQCQQKLKEIERLITKHQQLQSQSQQKSEELNGFIAQLENELAGARADITGLEEELAGKTQQVMHYFKQVEDLRRQDERQTREATNQRFQLQSQWNEIDSLRRRNDSLQVQLQSRPLRHSVGVNTLYPCYAQCIIIYIYLSVVYCVLLFCSNYRERETSDQKKGIKRSWLAIASCPTSLSVVTPSLEQALTVQCIAFESTTSHA